MPNFGVSLSHGRDTAISFETNSSSLSVWFAGCWLISMLSFDGNNKHSHWFVFQSRKGDGNKVTHYDRKQIVKRFSEKTNDLVSLQSITSAWYSLECCLVLTCYSKIFSKNKWMITWFDLQLRWLNAN